MFVQLNHKLCSLEVDQVWLSPLQFNYNNPLSLPAKLEHNKTRYDHPTVVSCVLDQLTPT